MSSPDPVQLASLLCSKLCHDLLSPVGALSNGLELLADETDPEMRDKCFELLDQSARISADKLRFFRLAFGAAGGFGAAVDMAEPRALVDALVSNNDRIRVEWALGVAKLPKGAVKVLLNFAQMGMDALVRGGTLAIGAEERDGASEIVVRAGGPKIAFDETIGHALDGQGELTARTAPAFMLHELAKGAGGGVQWQKTADALLLGAVLPAGNDGMIG